MVVGAAIPCWDYRKTEVAFEILHDVASIKHSFLLSLIPPLKKLRAYCCERLRMRSASRTAQGTFSPSWTI